jgi:hypothetical protein
MVRILAFSGLLLTISLSSCARDAPTEAEPAATEQARTGVPTLSAEERTSVAAAIADAQAWLLPSLDAGDGAMQPLARRLRDLVMSLQRSESGARAWPFAAARQELEARAAQQPGERVVELEALALELDGVEAVLERRLRLSPHSLRQP